MAKDYSLSNAAILGMLDNLDATINGGTGAVINIYSGCVPTNADAALCGNTLLAQLAMCSCNAFGCAADVGGCNLGRLTANCITDDCAADATGTATFFRILTQCAGTVVTQGTVGTTACFDLNLNTACITACATVSITSMTVDLLE